MKTIKDLTLKQADALLTGFSIIDGVEGSLIDNIMAEDKNGNLYLFIETYQNAWSSVYTLYIAETEEEKTEAGEFWRGVLFRVEYQAHYCPAHDTTYIMKVEYTKPDDVLNSMEVIGFYCGEPNEEATQFYIENPSIKASF